MINYGGSPPPAPEIQAKLISPVSGVATAGIRCIIDTGASITCMPVDVIRSLGRGLDYRSTRVVTAVGSGDRLVYMLHLSFERCRFYDLEVLAVEAPFGLIGRDILNKYRLLLDGVERMWKVEGCVDL